MNPSEPYIETASGTAFHFDDPPAEEILIDDVAHALSHICRFNGHTQRFYSVAEHSLLIARWLERQGHPPLVCYTGLLHDAAEAYINDLPRPIKYAMPEYRAMEKTIELAVAVRFGTTYPVPPVIKEADARIILDERRSVMNPRSRNKWVVDDLEPLGVMVVGWEPGVAKSHFLNEYHRLSGIINQ
jgi:hypothetical protein